MLTRRKYILFYLYFQHERKSITQLNYEMFVAYWITFFKKTIIRL